MPTVVLAERRALHMGCEPAWFYDSTTVFNSFNLPNSDDDDIIPHTLVTIINPHPQPPSPPQPPVNQVPPSPTTFDIPPLDFPSSSTSNPTHTEIYQVCTLLKDNLDPRNPVVDIRRSPHQ